MTQDPQKTTWYLLVLMALTGLFLSFYYLPHPLSAYESVSRIQNSIFLGRLVRGLHKYLALVVVIWFLANFYATLYRNAANGAEFVRSLTRGLFLIFLVLALYLTGYLLPWDQPSYAKVVSSLGLFGFAGTLSEGALFRFYWLHILALPALLFWLTREPEAKGKE